MKNRRYNSVRVNRNRASPSALRNKGKFISHYDEKKIKEISKQKEFKKYDVKSVLDMYFENKIRAEGAKGMILQSVVNNFDRYAEKNPKLIINLTDIGNKTSKKVPYAKIRDKISDEIKEIFRRKRSMSKKNDIPYSELPIIDISFDRQANTEIPDVINLNLNQVYSDDTSPIEYVRELFSKKKRKGKKK